MLFFMVFMLSRHSIFSRPNPSSSTANLGTTQPLREINTSNLHGGASKEIGLEVNTEKTKTKYMLLFHHQNARQNRDMKIGNRCFENVEQFR
jgi:hypothetical protein